ncbi:hypothetical protein SNE40_007046 [Patella caerulea]|uniref:Transmembrane protein 45B n=1 Tax=Patella caerulea TaxID=87958 RepID=A0AAN8PUG2_PATCE
MGTFGGHALPGCFFLFIGLWHVIQIYRRYYQCKRDNLIYTTSTWFPIDCCCGKLKEFPVEVVVKIFLISVAFSLEIFTGSHHGVFDSPGNEQHATMFFFFGVTGVFEILLYYKASFPPLLNYVGYTLSFSVEFVLFKFHLHGRSDMDVLLHTLLLFVIGACILSVLVEMKYQHHVLASLTSNYVIMVQGSWFLHIGFILYNPIPGAVAWDQESHRQMMSVTSYFAWHTGFNLLIIVIIGTVISYIYRKKYGYEDEDSTAMKRLIHTNSNGQTIVNMNDDSEEEAEF